jgi:hypothetical protein
MGLFALPNIIVFQMILPLVSPFIDVMFLYGIVNYFIDRHYHPESVSSASLDKLLVFFLGFLVIDFITSTVAFSLERNHPANKAALPHLAAKVCLPPGLLHRPLQDRPARN